MIVWFTGLSGSGKSTLASHLSRHFEKSYILDGDVLRKTVCSDLGFSQEDRKENLRRAAHIAVLLENVGYNVFASFISPLEEHRKMILDITQCHMLWVDADLFTCIDRDPKGLYSLALNGHIENFTGLTSIYEEPLAYHLRLDTSNNTIKKNIKEIISYFEGL